MALVLLFFLLAAHGGFKLRFGFVYLLYITLGVWVLRPPLCSAVDFHGERLEEALSRPKAPQFSGQSQEIDNLLVKTLEELQTIESSLLIQHLKQILKHPQVVQYRSPDILRALNNLQRYEDRAQAFCLELLATLENPELISIFESYLKSIDREGEVRFPATQGLGRIYKKHPEFFTKARKEVLFEILNAKDDNDLTRLYLRQNLPPQLAKELDEQVYEWQMATRPKNALAKVTQQGKHSALGLATNPQAQPARRALAFQALLEMEPSTQKLVSQINQFLNQVVSSSNEKPARFQMDESLLHGSQKDKLNEFVARTENHPKGLGLYIHDGIQLENLITLARQKGIELDPKTLSSVHELTESQFRAIWNGGDFLVQYNRNSNLSNFAHAALIVSQGNRPLSPTLSEALNQLHQLRKEVHPESGLPRLFNYTSEGYRKDATPASSAGRALTGQLAFFNRALPEDKAREAQDLLERAHDFETHFSQLFELANYFRSHDRNPSGEGMAPYYGFGNAPYAAEALVKLKTEPSLTESQKKEVRWLAERYRNRLLNLMRFEDRFTENSDYNMLAMIALKKLDGAFGFSERK